MIYEKRTVIPAKKIEEILEYFDKNCTKKRKEKQIIYNYHTEGQLRIIKTNNYSKLDYQDNKNKNEIFITKQYSDELINLFNNIGIAIEFKRYRTRYKYIYNGFYITIDHNYKTGNVMRLKKEYNLNEEKDKLDSIYKEILEILSLEETNLDKFNEIYGKYRTSWTDLTKDINDLDFLNSN